MKLITTVTFVISACYSVSVFAQDPMPNQEQKEVIENIQNKGTIKNDHKMAISPEQINKTVEKAKAKKKLHPKSQK